MIGWVATTAAAGAAWAIGTKLLHLPRPQVGALMACTFVANTGYLGYPLVAALLGLDAVGEAVAYDVGVSAPALLIGAFATGAAFGTRAGSGARERTGSFFARNLPSTPRRRAPAPDALPRHRGSKSADSVIALCRSASSAAARPWTRSGRGSVRVPRR